MAARIPTQNNLGEVIKSLNENLSAFSSLMQIVSGILDDKSVFLQKDYNKRVKTIEKRISSIFGPDGLMDTIVSQIEQTISRSTKGKLETLEKESIKPVIDAIKAISNILDNRYLTGFTVGRTMMIRRNLRGVERTFDQLFKFINRLGKKNLNTKAVKQLNLLAHIVGKITKMVTALILLGPVFLAFIIMSPVLVIGFWVLIRVLNLMSRIADGVRFGRRGILGLMRVRAMILVIGIIAVSLVIIGAMALLVVKLAVPILAMFGIIILIMLGLRLMVWITSKIMSVEAVEGLAVVALLIGVIMAISIMLLVVASISLLIAKSWKSILLMFGIITAVAAAAVGMGLGMTLLLPMVPGMLAGIAALTVIIGAIMFISMMLLLLQQLKLDKEKILVNVHIVLDTAKAIIGMLFEDEEEPGKQKDNMFTRIIKSIFRGASMIIEMILAAALLTMTVVSVTMILFIALELRLLQVINLKPEEIKRNVSLVLGTAKSIISTLFDPINPEENDKPKTGFQIFIKWAFSRIATILDAIFSVAVLAMTFVSVGMILLIAMMLRGLQNIDLDHNKVRERVGLVLDTARNIISSIFDYRDEKEDNEPKTWFGSFISWAFERFSAIIDAILSVAFLSLTVIAIGIVMLIAKQLKAISQFDIDPNEARDKAAGIINAAMTVMNSIFDFKKDLKTAQPSTWVGELIQWAFPDFYNFVKMITSVLFLAVSLAGIGCIKRVGEALNEIVKFDVNPELAKQKAQQVVAVAKDIVNQINIEGTIFDNIGKKWKLGKVAKMFGDIKLIAETMTYLKDFDLSVITSSGDIANKIVIEAVKLVRGPKGASDTFWRDLNEAYKDISKAMGRVSEVFGLFAGIGSSEEDMKKALTTAIYTGECMKRIANADFDNTAVMNKARVIGFASMSLKSWFNMSSAEVALNKQLVEQNIKFFEKINSVDIEKLKTTEKMFKNMAKFSETISGNFEGLADTLNNKIAPIIEELSKKIDDVKALQAEAIDDNNANSGNEKAVSENTATKRVAKAPVGGLIQYGKDQEGDSFTISKESRKAYMRATKNGKDIGAILNVLTGNGGTGGVLTRTR